MAEPTSRKVEQATEDRETDNHLACVATTAVFTKPVKGIAVHARSLTGLSDEGAEACNGVAAGAAEAAAAYGAAVVVDAVSI